MKVTELKRAHEACEREPIHLIGAIQPHGVLVAFQRHAGRIAAASANAGALFGMDELLERPIGDVLEAGVLQSLGGVVDRGETRAFSQFVAVANAGDLGAMHEVSAHVAGELVHVELEALAAGAAGAGIGAAHGMAAALEGLATGSEFFHEVASQVRQLVGYDRVMVYRFLHDHSGEVIAESCADDMAPYLGLRYPASDIPAQARQLYVHNRIRVIPDVGYRPVPVQVSPALAGPFDMSFDVLRSVSAVHVEYLRNMGIAASMSISLVVEGRLWGLVACHHRAPRRVSARQRTALDMFGRHVSMILATRDLRESARRMALARERRDCLEERLAANAPEDVLDAAALDALGHALPADGFAVYWRGGWVVRGATPDAASLEQALAWARAQASDGSAGTALARDWQSTGTPATPVACGLLAVRRSASTDDWLLLFRSEQREQVRWAGRPDEAYQLDVSRLKIGPRTSFEAWDQLVAGSSPPWTDEDRRIADRVRLLLHRYLPTSAPSAAPAAIDDELLDGEVLEATERLRRVAVLLQESSAQLDRGQIGRLRTLALALEDEVAALARTQPA